MKKLVTKKFTDTVSDGNHFTAAENLANYINNHLIQNNDIVSIYPSENIDTFVLFYYVEDISPAEGP